MKVSAHLAGQSLVKTLPKPNKMPGRITGRVCKSQIDGLQRKVLQAEDLKLLTTEEERLKY